MPTKNIVLSPENALAEADDFIRAISPYPNRYKGRGIVMCGGGLRYFPCAWVCVKMLRQWGCELPIQLWHLGAKEMNDFMRGLIEPYGVECVDGLQTRALYPARILNGWELKCYSILHSPFQEVLFLDADNICTKNPEFLFETTEYKKNGAIFWPDYSKLKPNRAIWKLCGVEYRDEPEFETGQMVIDKERCWKALNLTMWYNEHSDFFYQYVYGDKETFHMAFRKLDQTYSMPKKPILGLEAVMCQHDFEGNRIFQHRNLDKWNLLRANKRINGFWHERDCYNHLEELRQLWNGRISSSESASTARSTQAHAVRRQLTRKIYEYHRVGHDRRHMTFLENGIIDQGAAGSELFWDVSAVNESMQLEIYSDAEITCRLKEDNDGVWRGRWLHEGQIQIELSPLQQSNWVTLARQYCS